VLPKEYGGDGDLLPIATACRRYKLPPFDGRVDPSTLPPAPSASAASLSEAQGPDAQLLVSEEDEFYEAGGKEGFEGETGVPVVSARVAA